MSAILTLQQPELIESLEQAATEQNTTAEELLQTAVNEFLDKIARQKIHAESQAFKILHPELLKTYSGQYVAVHNGQVVDHDEDARTLYLRIQERFGRVAILIRQVTPKAENELVFRSPRLARVKP